ncbi:hypothetical protein ACO0LD_05285 [Undibacterium sp. Ji83W]|uniref:hypothetical protein n=1 Tax=Undibacterium sp. Ji83W TaxID=3413043 RepID=UPI003BF030A6
MKYLSIVKKISVGAALLMVGAAAMAADPAPVDLSPLTNQFTATVITTAVLAVAGVLATIYVVIRGAKIALSMIRGG